MDDNKSVEFKGTGQGLSIKIHLHHDGLELKKIIQQRINENHSFYKGATVADITCEALSETTRQALEQWLVDDYEMSINPKSAQPNEKLEETAAAKMRRTNDREYSTLSQEHGTKFVEGTLRSGQKVEHPGDVVVIGDVNPGAEIFAGGNIVVMGVLRGIAHAGIYGKTDAFVAASVLQPTQLRIHQTITRSPDEGTDKSKIPEIAKLKDQVICVEPF